MFERRDRFTARQVMAASAVAMAAALALPAPAIAQSVVNPGFETGDASGWTTSGGFWFSGTWPPPESEYSNPPHLISVMSAGGVDAITGTPTVFAGNFALRLNDQFGGNDISALSQSVNGYAGTKLYYAWNAVLEPSHGATDSPSFIIKVVDRTTNTVIKNIAYSAFTAQNVPALFRTTGAFVTTDWKVEDIDMTNGHDYDLIFVAVDCLYGGHGGYVYVDGFGNAIPTPNPDVDFDPATDVINGDDVLIPIDGKPDIDTAKPFYTTTELFDDLVNPNFVGGTLQTDTATEVTNNFTVQTQGGTIDTNGFDVTFTGAFTGAGGLAKTGLGALILTNTSAINGGFDVNQGNLQMNGALSALEVNVNNGGTLSGDGGVIANINVAEGGTLAPGAPIGTLNVVGDVTMNPGATFALDIDGRNYVTVGGPGTYDRLEFLDGQWDFVADGTIAPNLRNIPGGLNNFTPVMGDVFTVVTRANISGAFDAVAQPTAGMAANTRFDVLYHARTIDLVVTPGNFATWGRNNGWKVNAISAAEGLDPFRPAAGARTGTLLSLFNGVYGMDSAQMGYAFSQISGEIHADALQTVQNTVRDTTSMTLQAATDSWGCAPTYFRKDGVKEDAPDCGPQSGRKGPSIWGKAIFDRVDVSEDDIAYGYQSNRTRGFIAGVNVVNQDGTRLGFGGRVVDGEITSDVGSKADVDDVGLFVYGSHRFGGLNIAATLGWNRGKIDTTRTVGFTTGVATATDAYKTTSISAALEARYDIEIGKRSVIRPVVGIEYTRTKADAVAESSATPNVALAMPKETWKSARTKVGVEAAIGVGNPVEAGVFANWRHELDEPTALRTAVLGPASWQVSSVAADKDSIEAGARLGIKVSDNVRVRFEYAISRDGSYNVDRGSAGVAIRF